MTEVRRLIIRGMVQGVGFRYAMAAQARLLGVSGWVRNRRDGTVEAMIAGAAEPVAEMLAWSHHGPAGASVDQVMVEIGSGEFSSFEQLPTA
ncbi:MAG: acylphosphatase [Rhodocyclales bacterium]|nr:acylphosphatase [Rhodocyclales bacterium]